MDEILDVVDENDNVLGQKTRTEVEAKGLRYRAAEIIVLVDGKILIEKRASTKPKRPGYYSVVSETMKSGESYEHAAVRGVKEETGLDAKGLKKIGKTMIKDKTANDLYIMTAFVCEGKGKIKLQEEEVDEIKLLSVQEIENLINSGEKVTQALVECMKLYKAYKGVVNSKVM